MKTAQVQSKRNVCGRLTHRLAGDRAGGVMMEYVILAVMIAAAVSLAVIFFGDRIAGGFDVMRKAIAGKTSEAEQAAADNQKEAKKQKALAQGSKRNIAPGQGR